MTAADKSPALIRFSIRSLLVLIAFAALVFIALNQYRQNQDLERRVEVLASQVDHLNACEEDMREKFGQLRDLVSAEQVFKVPSTP